jgi:hypothetical protein
MFRRMSVFAGAFCLLAGTVLRDGRLLLLSVVLVSVGLILSFSEVRRPGRPARLSIVALIVNSICAAIILWVISTLEVNRAT